jgi:hypothetical protein
LLTEDDGISYVIAVIKKIVEILKMKIKDLGSAFVKAAFIPSAAFIGIMALQAYRLSEGAEDKRVELLSNGYNENQALCVKRQLKSWPIESGVLSNGNERKKMLAEAYSVCGIVLK